MPRLYCGAWELFVTYSLLWLLEWFFAGFGDHRSTSARALKPAARFSCRPAPSAFLLYFLVWHLSPCFFGLGSRCTNRMSGGCRIYSLGFSRSLYVFARQFCPSRWMALDRVLGWEAKRRSA